MMLGFCQLNFFKFIIKVKKKRVFKMKANFDYLKNNQLLKDEYQTANKIVKLYEIEDYRDVIINARLFLEEITKLIIKWENLNCYYPLKDGEHYNLRNNTQYLRENLDYPLIIFKLFDEVRRLGNEAVHDSKFQINPNQAWHVICNVNDILVFLLNSYNGQKLNYLRPDLNLEASDHPDKFGMRKLKMTEQTERQNIRKNNVEQAQSFLKNKQKKHYHLRKLRHFFKH